MTSITNLKYIHTQVIIQPPGQGIDFVPSYLRSQASNSQSSGRLLHLYLSCKTCDHLTANRVASLLQAEDHWPRLHRSGLLHITPFDYTRQSIDFMLHTRLIQHDQGKNWMPCLALLEHDICRWHEGIFVPINE